MTSVGDAFVVIGAVVALAASMFRYVHLARIIDHLETNYPGVVRDLAGGDAKGNFLLFRRRLNDALASDALAGLGDDELLARIRIFRLARKGIASGVVVTLIGIAILFV